MESEAKQCEIENLQSKVNELMEELQHLKSMHPFDGETSFSSQLQRKHLEFFRFFVLNRIHWSSLSNLSQSHRESPGLNVCTTNANFSVKK